MNRTYRNDFARRVNAARTIREPRYGRALLITHASFNAFDREIRAKRDSGEISVQDYVNCRSFIGEAVNAARPD